MEGFGKRSYEKLIEAIERSKNVKMENFLYSLGIPQIGKSASKTVTKYFRNDWFAFETALNSKFDFTELEDFGATTNENLYKWYESSDERNMWSELTSIVQFIHEEKKEVIDTDNPFNGKSVYPTGKFVLKKDELKAKLEELGAIVENGYKKSLDMLIAGGDTSKSGKVDKAKADGIKIVTEEFLMQYIK